MKRSNQEKTTKFVLSATLAAAAGDQKKVEEVVGGILKGEIMEFMSEEEYEKEIASEIQDLTKKEQGICVNSIMKAAKALRGAPGKLVKSVGNFVSKMFKNIGKLLEKKFPKIAQQYNSMSKAITEGPVMQSVSQGVQSAREFMKQVSDKEGAAVVVAPPRPPRSKKKLGRQV